VKIRIGISAGGESLGPEAMVALAQGIAGTGFDSLWLPEVLTRPGPDPLVGLAWVAGACPGLKIGTTMLLPGRNLVWLAKAVATLDVLSGGRLLLTFVPGLAVGGESSAIGIPTATRAEQMEDALPVLRQLWSGKVVSHEGPAASFTDVSVSPQPAQHPFDVWLGGNVPAALDRCGRLADGWLPAFCTPADAAAGRAVIDEAASAHGRAIARSTSGSAWRMRPKGRTLVRWRRRLWRGGPAAVRSKTSSRSGAAACAPCSSGSSRSGSRSSSCARWRHRRSGRGNWSSWPTRWATCRRDGGGRADPYAACNARAPSHPHGGPRPS
jgi:alkanesulfonate monooxygenase SsuD/methylene tetrahydromethanopterin reductase-like flavin-dependent oxidoreductase (luciferase family)